MAIKYAKRMDLLKKSELGGNIMSVYKFKDVETKWQQKWEYLLQEDCQHQSYFQ